MTIVRRCGDWLSAKLGDELVMMSAQSGNYITLSRVGARTWELIEKPMSLDDLCSRLVDDYDVEEATCRADVARFIDEMVEHGAIALDPHAVG